MATPSKKSPGMVRSIDSLAESWFGRPRSDSIKQDICVCCGEPAIHFDDDLSRKEYSISGMCQICQDEIFG